MCGEPRGGEEVFTENVPCCLGVRSVSADLVVDKQKGTVDGQRKDPEGSGGSGTGNGYPHADDDA